MGECLTNTLASVTLNMNQIAAFAASQWKELFNTSRCTFPPLYPFYRTSGLKTMETSCPRIDDSVSDIPYH